jgi:hypothetical protein
MSKHPIAVLAEKTSVDLTEIPRKCNLETSGKEVFTCIPEPKPKNYWKKQPM